MNSRIQAILYGAAGVIGAVLLWQLAALAQVFGQSLPLATDTLQRFIAILALEETWIATGDTLFKALIGLIIAIVVGVVGGILVGTIPLIDHATRVILEVLKPLPAIVILPIAVLVFGPNTDMGIFLVAFGCAIQILIQTASGVLSTDPVALDTARSFKMGTIERLVRIILPSTTPEIVSAIRIGAPTAIVIAIVAELFGGAPGLGQRLYEAMRVVDTEGVFAIVILLGILGLLVLWVTSAAERRILHWHASIRERQKA